jgi:hypothetical protein
MRRTLAWTLVGACGLLAVVACGSFGSDGTSTASSADAGAAPADASAAREPPLTTFSCGMNQCTAGSQACCQISGAFGCFGIDAGGCPASPAGVDAGGDGATVPAAPLLCTSYRNCDGYDECCYEPALGSSCQAKCGTNAASLCEVGRDNCGSVYGACKTLASPPQTGIGKCDFSSNGGGSSSGWHF